jgi:hypothetical protein
MYLASFTGKAAFQIIIDIVRYTVQIVGKM